MWDVVVGFVSATFLLPIIQQPRWTERVRAAVTFAWCVVTGLVTAYLTGAFGGIHDVRAGVTSVLFTLVTAIASYHGFAKPTGIASSIEEATSPSPSLT